MTFKPHLPYNTVMFLYIPSAVTVKGSAKKVIPEKGKIMHCCFRSFGGTERNVNDVLTVEDTAVIETRYRPDITADCVLKDIHGKSYEILGTPENIEMINRYLVFKVRAVKGGA